MPARLIASAGAVARDALNAKGTQRRKLTKRLAMLCVASSVGGLLTTRAPRAYLAALNAQYRTELGAVRQATLADGTQMWLNTDSAVDTEYSNSLRRIIVHRGEVLIQTASDQLSPKRPLVVDSRDGRMLALGTRFTVRLEEQATRLAVLESAVRIDPANSTTTQVLNAGHEVRFGADWIGTATTTDASAAAWSRHLLMADNMRLDDFLAELSRYRRGYLDCAPEIADLRLVGVYPLADTDRILNALAASLPINVRRILPWWISVEAAS